jgi:putative transposase
MPARNTVRLDVEDQYYHVYNRGINFQPIFLESTDKDFFLHIIERYLSFEPVLDKSGNKYVSFAGKLELNCYCLMGNHYHLLFFQKERGALTGFMRALTNTYVRYFNNKYERRGPLFESRYKSSLIDNQSYLEHISRYIHLNPNKWRTYNYSSLGAYLGQSCPSWLIPSRILDVFDGDDYLNFVSDYEDNKKMLEDIKHQLADTAP